MHLSVSMYGLSMKIRDATVSLPSHSRFGLHLQLSTCSHRKTAPPRGRLTQPCRAPTSPHNIIISHGTLHNCIIEQLHHILLHLELEVG